MLLSIFWANWYTNQGETLASSMTDVAIPEQSVDTPTSSKVSYSTTPTSSVEASNTIQQASSINEVVATRKAATQKQRTLPLKPKERSIFL